VARKILLDQLTGQARSRKELSDKLASRNVPDEIATALLDRFEEVGLVDDEAFARSWIASRQPGKGLARRALARSCAARASTTRSPAMRSTRSIPPTRRRPRAPWSAKKLRTLSRVDDTTATRRLVGMLARKGYALRSGVRRRPRRAAAADRSTADLD
jgi:regulatory protein